MFSKILIIITASILILTGFGCSNKKPPVATSPYSQQVFEAIEKKDVAQVEALIKKDPAALNAPASLKHCRSVGNSSLRVGDTPLHYAAQSPDTLMIVKALIKAKADVSIANEDGEQPLQKAALLGNPGAVQELILTKADINARDNQSRTSLHSVSDMEPFENAAGERDHRTETASSLISAGADVNATDNMGMTPLHLAALHHHTGLIELFIKKGADVNARTTAPVNMVNMRLDGSSTERSIPSQSTPLSFADDPKAKALLQKHGAK